MDNRKRSELRSKLANNATINELESITDLNISDVEQKKQIALTEETEKVSLTELVDQLRTRKPNLSFDRVRWSSAG